MMLRPGVGPGGALLIAVLLMSVTPASAAGTGAVPSETDAETVTPSAALAVIDAAIREHRFDAAATLIARTRPTGDSPQLQLRAAELTLAAGDLPGAVTAFTDLLGETGVEARAQQGLGLARLRQSDVPAAIAALDAALARDPGLARAWTARGVAADRRRDFAAADAAYARALALAPASADALTNRGYSLMLRGRFADAEADLGRAIAIEPGLETAVTNLRFARAMQGRYRDAFLGSTRDGLAADLNTVGFAAMARGDFPTAETYFNRALALNSRFARTAWANLEYLKQRTAPKMGLRSAADLAETDRRLQVPR